MGAIGAIIFLFRFFNHDACLYNGENPGKTGTKLLLWTIPIGVISKTIAVYYYANFFSGAFILSMMVKSLGLCFISLHLFLIAYNHRSPVKSIGVNI